MPLSRSRSDSPDTQHPARRISQNAWRHRQRLQSARVQGFARGDGRAQRKHSTSDRGSQCDGFWQRVLRKKQKFCVGELKGPLVTRGGRPGAFNRILKPTMTSATETLHRHSAVCVKWPTSSSKSTRTTIRNDLKPNMKMCFKKNNNQGVSEKGEV